MEQPSINDIKIFNLFSQSISHTIVLNVTNLDKSRQIVLLAMNNRVYEVNPDLLFLDVIIAGKNAINTLTEKSNENDELRIKAFIYDFIDDKIVNSKLQEFKYDVNQGKYLPSDKLFNTSPFVIGNWDKYRTEVDTVELISKLDIGSDNDGKRTFKQPGIVFGKKYEFKVASYTHGTPKDKKNITWVIKYHNLDKNEWEEITLDKKGEKIVITMNNLEMCGRFLYVRAYIRNSKKDNSLKVWKHNRFRWLDRMVLKDEVAIRQNHPDLANQRNTPLCGMASTMYLLAKKDFNLYEDFILSLHRKGFFKINNYLVDVENSLHLLDVNPEINKKFPHDNGGKMTYCDWISFSSVRNQENAVRNYDGLDDPEIDGATLPNEIVKLMKDLLNFKKVTDYTNLVTNKGALPWDGEFSSIRELAKMQELFDKGYEIVMLVNTNFLKNKVSDDISFPEHLIVYEGFTNKKTISPEIYEFDVFSWGSIMRLKLTPDMFRTNFYGYIYGK